MSDIRFSQAASAYQDALRAAERILQQTSIGNTGAAEKPESSGFLGMVSESLKSAAQAGYKSEEVAVQALSGKADLTDVVTAVANAETALNTVVTVRDRVINAYQDIIKMPI